MKNETNSKLTGVETVGEAGTVPMRALPTPYARREAAIEVFKALCGMNPALATDGRRKLFEAVTNELLGYFAEKPPA